MSAATDFDTWWTENYFYKLGQHKLLWKTLGGLSYRNRASVDFIRDIDALGKLLIYGDTVTAETADSLEPRRRRHRANKAPTPLPSVATLGWLAKFAIVQQEQLYQFIKRFGAPVALPALLEFQLLPAIHNTLSRRGDKLDSWGSFFLLAVTELMEQELGNPKFRVADDLLRAYRTLASSYRFKKRELSWGKARAKSRAISRIRKLKEDHPLWPEVLDPLLLQLQLNRDGVTKYRASARNFLEQWKTTNPLAKLVDHHTRKCLENLSRIDHAKRKYPLSVKARLSKKGK